MSNTTVKSCYDIIIIGAGMVGASFALMLHAMQKLRRHGKLLNIAVLESAGYDQRKILASPGYDGRSLALSWGSKRIFSKIQLWQRLQAEAEPIKTVHVSKKGHLGSLSFRAEEEGLPALGYVVDSQWLGGILSNQLLNLTHVDVFHSVAINELKPCALGGRVNFSFKKNAPFQPSKGKQYFSEAALVVIADGGRSSLHQSLGFEKKVHNYGHHAIVTTLHVDRPHKQVAYERFTEEGSLALLPLSLGRYGVVWTMPESLAEERMQLIDTDFSAEFQQRFGYRAGIFSQPGRRIHYPLTQSIAKEQCMPGFLLLGSAAHHLHPVAGQGFNLCLRDIKALVDVLDAALTNGESIGGRVTLNRYVDRQLRDQMLTTGVSHSLVHLFSQTDARKSSKIMAGLCSTALLTLGAVKPLKSAFLRTAMRFDGGAL